MRDTVYCVSCIGGDKLGLFNRSIKPDKATVFKMITETGNGFYAWNGKLYQSDIIRSCIRPASKSVGKLIAKHVRKSKDGLLENPDPYIRFLLEEPNAHMTGQVMQEKIITQLMLNSNAFIAIIRDDFGLARELYPITCTGVQTEYDDSGKLYLKFTLTNGTFLTLAYTDVIHIRRDFNENDLFGTSPKAALESVMEVVTATDQGVVKAIKNSTIIKWLLKFKSVLKPEDIDLQVKKFVDNYMSLDSNTIGAAATTPQYDAEQVKAESYVPNAAQMDRAITRLYNFYNTNLKIIQSDAPEDVWNSYYEMEIEPIAMQLSGEYTRKLFSRKERGFGNKIIFSSFSLQYASMNTKLQLVTFIDRGMMTPNEVREILNMGPIEFGDQVIRRLDTATVEGGGD